MHSHTDSTDGAEKKAPSDWSTIAVHRSTHRLIAEVSSRLKLSPNATVLQALERLSKVEAPTMQHLSRDLLHATEILEISTDRLANSLESLEETLLALTAARLLETENLIRSRQHGSDND